MLLQTEIFQCLNKLKIDRIQLIHRILGVILIILGVVLDYWIKEKNLNFLTIQLHNWLPRYFLTSKRKRKI